ncbi:MAG: fibronectin type III domain-containing protein [Euryarchaeota archaeon]|nr:fibronectin type III domain-containing protein [Euryarchaeota archaeon]
MIKQARTAGLLKLKTTVLILVLVLCISITAATASQIVIEDADTIWNVTSDYPPKLINTTDNVTPRVTVDHANTIYHNVLAILTGLTNVTNIVTARITAEYANTVYCADLDKLPAALANLSHTVVPSRLIFVSANTNHCEELIYPKEFMSDTIPPIITDISIINLVNNSAKVTWITDEFADSVLKYGMNSTAYTETCKDELFVKEHEITLTGLSLDTTYYFVVNSTDQSGNSAESSEYSFKYDG